MDAADPVVFALMVEGRREALRVPEEMFEALDAKVSDVEIAFDWAVAAEPAGSKSVAAWVDAVPSPLI
jgi:hypothetical protein